MSKIFQISRSEYPELATNITKNNVLFHQFKTKFTRQLIQQLSCHVNFVLVIYSFMLHA